MRISWRRVSLALPGLVLACSIDSSSEEPSSGSSSSSSSSGCGGGGDSASRGGWNGADTPKDDGRFGAPSEPAPTGQQWKPIETDEGCGRMGITWVLVDEVCGDGEGNDNPDSLHAPMFRDGAIMNGHLYAVDATHLWTFDLAKPSDTSRASLVTGLGTPLAVDQRGSELVLAAGTDGLVMVDTTNPGAPRRSRSAALSGKAFDVQVGGDTAYVAMGAAGLAEVDLGSSTPIVKHSWPVAGFSAGVAARGGYAYVAACSTFKIVDLADGKVVSEAWVPNAIVKGRLVAPAKKVTLVGDVAFVAAGRHGAVAIDVSDPRKPAVLGNCTIPNEPSFYASGVRAGGDKLYVAGGEWGILPVDVADAKGACQKTMAQSVPPDESDVSCSAKPPWEVVPWESIWAPPPPAKDPIQTLPMGDRVYAFGDARRVGVRAVDVRDTRAPSLPIVKRFDEPRALLGIAATANRVVAVGPRGGVFAVAPNGVVTRSPSSGDSTLRAGTAVTLLPDGRWVALGAKGLDVEGESTTIPAPDASSLSVTGDGKLVVASKGLEVIDVDAGTRFTPKMLHAAHLPLSVAADAKGIYYAAPEWPTTARLAGMTSSDLPQHAVFDADAIMDASLWRTRLPRRHLVASARGLVEIAGVGASVGLVVHAGTGVAKLALPAMTYVAAAGEGNRVYLAAIDRSLYRSFVVSVDISGAPKVLAVESFTGAASSLAVAAGRVFVADADGALRTYRVASSGVAELLSTTEVTP